MALIGLIPRPPRPGSPARREHLAFVVGGSYAQFADRYQNLLIGRQDHGSVNETLSGTFDEVRTVGFHRHSLPDEMLKEGRFLEGLHHADQ